MNQYGRHTIFVRVRKQFAESSRRHYVSAAFGTNLYGPVVILFLWIGLLLCASVGELLPGDSASIKALSSSGVNDKFLHFSTYAAIAFVPMFGLRITTAIICVIATEVVGIGLDLAQLFVHQRSCDPRDIVANTAGIVFGIVVAVISRSRIVRPHYTPSDES